MTSCEAGPALQCLVCSTVNPPDEQLCKHCGKPLLDWEEIAEAYSVCFTEQGFWEKIAEERRNAGIEATRRALTLYYTLTLGNTKIPEWARDVIAAALGLFVAPNDMIPDQIPRMGYTDDFAVLTVATQVLEAYVSPEASMRADETIAELF
jgi:uncharacterized membrane protein YkvA (DUF1232 family)